MTSSTGDSRSSQTAVIGIAVVEHAGKFLVGIREAGIALAGLAEFPGGKCLPGEQPPDCARRECLEETGLDVSPVELLFHCEHEYEPGRVDLHFWRCRPSDPAKVAAAHRAFRWIPRDELATLNFPAANAPVIAILTRLS